MGHITCLGPIDVHVLLICVNDRVAVQCSWHYIDKLSNDTVPNHTFIYNQSAAITKLYLFTNELTLRDYFRCFRSKNVRPHV